MITLRDYQACAIDRVREAYVAGHRCVLLVMPTGAGKTITFAYLAHSAVTRGKRVLILAHREFLIEQISETLSRFDLDHGALMAGRPGNTLPVQVGMMGTVARRLERIYYPDLIVVDEAHRSVSATYMAILRAFPKARVLGVTATPQRTDGCGLGDAYDAIVIGPTVRELTDAGHLSRYALYCPPQMVDLEGVPIRAGDFDQKALADRMDRPTITGDAIEHLQRLAPGRQFVAFCAGVEHAHHVAEQFRGAGIGAQALDGEMDRSERASIVAAFRGGALQGLTSCDLISEGFDLPGIGAAILLRPTASLIVYMQQVGRALRPAPGKDRAVLLDHVGNALRHGLPDHDRDWTLEGRDKAKKANVERELSVRHCRVCFAVYETRLPKCPHCGAVAGTESREIAERDGELVEITEVMRQQEAEWAFRDELAVIPYGEALARCDTPDKLRLMAQARGYKPGWAIRLLSERKGITPAEAAKMLGYKPGAAFHARRRAA